MGSIFLTLLSIYILAIYSDYGAVGILYAPHVCNLLAAPFFAAAGYYWCKGTNMLDMKDSATKIRMGAIVAAIGYFLVLLGEWILLGASYDVPGYLIALNIFAVFWYIGLTYYIWNVALRYQGYRVAVSRLLPSTTGQQY